MWAKTTSYVLMFFFSLNNPGTGITGKSVAAHSADLSPFPGYQSNSVWHGSRPKVLLPFSTGLLFPKALFRAALGPRRFPPHTRESFEIPAAPDQMHAPCYANKLTV